VTGYSWLSVEARTGLPIADLPLLDVANVKASVGRYETTTATLPIATEVAPPEWERAVRPNTAHIILLADNPDDPAHGIPLIGYRITQEVRDETDVVSLDLATLESYLDGRYVGDVTFNNIGQNTIATTLITNYVKDGARPGIPIRVQVTTPGVGVRRTRAFFDSDDKTIYSVFTDLAGVIDGFEWYIGWEWQYNPDRLTPVLYVGDRVGAATTPGLEPNATFEMPGPVKSFRRVRDYKQGRGATDVMATSSGQDGDSRPQSAHQIANDPDQPTIEYRFTPSTSISNVSTLNGHAQTALAALKNGSTAVEMTAVAADAPILGVDWGLGADVGFVIGGTDSTGRETVPSFPGGMKGTARVAGWSLDLGRTPVVTPVLVSPEGAFV
jgi:hypothetical protein